MTGQADESERVWADKAAFSATHWSVILAAGNSDSAVRSPALERLCKAYWPAVYAFVRRSVLNSEDARDVTQGFFSAFLENQGFARADQTRGRFRTFLLHSVQNFMRNEWRKARAERRGGGAAHFSLELLMSEPGALPEPVESMTPEQAYDKRWALATLEQVMLLLQEDYARTGKQALFDRLRVSLWEDKEMSYAEVAGVLNMTEAAVKMAASRLRARARQALFEVIANTVSSDSDYAEEVQHFAAILRG